MALRNHGTRRRQRQGFIAAFNCKLVPTPEPTMPISHPSFESLAQSFERNTVFQHMHPYELYRKWLEAVWAFLEAVTHPADYRTKLDAYTFAQGREFGRLLNLYIETAEALPFHDILGSLFMRLDVKSASAGQYFTPFEIAVMMAKLQFDKAHFQERAAAQGYVTVCDPAVGSGVISLSLPHVVFNELGPEGLRQVRFYGCDIDLRCVLMCRIQLRINGLDGIGGFIRHAFTPANPEPPAFVPPFHQQIPDSQTVGQLVLF